MVLVMHRAIALGFTQLLKGRGQSKGSSRLLSIIQMLLIVAMKEQQFFSQRALQALEVAC